MGLFKDRKKEEAPAKVGFVGKEMHVNPSDDVALDRLETRLERVKELLQDKFAGNHPRGKEFMRIKRRLQMQIKLKKGDY